MFPTEVDCHFEHVYPHSGNQEVSRMILTSEGLTMIGKSTLGENRLLLYTVGPCGDFCWQKELDPGTEGSGIIQTSDKNLALVGSISDSDGDRNLLLIKCDLEGNTIWQKNFGGALSDQGQDLIELENGDFMMIGTTQSFGAGPASIYIIKTDSEGNEIWSRTFGGTGLDGGSELIQTSSFEVLLLGFTESFGAGNRDIYLQSVSTDGDSLWSSTYGGSGYEESQAIAKTSDGGYIMSNHSASNEPDHSILATRLDANGQMQWEREFGTPTAHEGGEAVLADSEGNYVFLGRSNSFGTDEQVFLIKTNAAGAILEEWNSGFEGKDQRGNDIIEHDGYYFVCGTSTAFGTSDVMLKKRSM